MTEPQAPGIAIVCFFYVIIEVVLIFPSLVRKRPASESSEEVVASPSSSSSPLSSSTSPEKAYTKGATRIIRETQIEAEAKPTESTNNKRHKTIKKEQPASKKRQGRVQQKQPTERTRKGTRSTSELPPKEAGMTEHGHLREFGIGLEKEVEPVKYSDGKFHKGWAIVRT